MTKIRTDKRDGHKYAVEEHGGFASEILGGRNSESNDREQELLEYAEEHDKYIDSEGNKIPESPYYVVMKDQFMSGWGMAEGKDNILIFDADSDSQAEIIKENAKNDNQKDIRIMRKLPDFDKDENYVQYKGTQIPEHMIKKYYEEGAVKKSTEKYNGYTNWETWEVNLEFDNDEGLYKKSKEIAKNDDLSEEEKEDALKDLIKDEHNANDYHEIDYGKVNWKEIIKAKREEE